MRRVTLCIYALLGLLVLTAGVEARVSSYDSEFWPMPDGTVVSVEIKEKETLIKTNDGKILISLPPPQVIENALQSTNDRVLIFLINDKKVQNPEVTSFWYNCLVIVSKQGDEGWVANRVLLKAQLRGTITEIGAISNDGSKAVVKVAAPNEEHPDRILYSWKTLQLSDGRVLAEGRYGPKDFDKPVEKK